MNIENPKIKIALVEDHAVVREAISKMLSEIPYFEFVFDAENGQDFLNQFKNKPVDVVLLDLEMPILNGIDTIKVLKKEDSCVKIIILTMHDDLDIAFELLSSGADAYLLKECSTREMIEAITMIHNDARYTNYFMNNAIINNLAESRKKQTRADYLQLSPRDLKLLKFICDGFSTKQISDLLPASVKNTDLLRTKLMKKMNVTSGNELIRVAILNNLYLPRTNKEIMMEIEDEANCKLNRRMKNRSDNHKKNFG
jgi:two-component system response regulator DegU